VDLQEIITVLIDDLYALRPFVLAASKDREDDVRGVLRRMASDMERLQQLPDISLEQYQWLRSMLKHLLDAEHGSLISGDIDHKLSEADMELLREHVELRRSLMDQAQLDIPILHKIIARCSGLIGEEISGSDDIATQGRYFEEWLRDHLSAEMGLRSALNSLIAAMNESLEALSSMLNKVGADAPELMKARHLLEQDLPDDPAAAQALLRQAREKLVSAGEHITEAGTAVQSRMQQQADQMSSLEDRLKEAEAQARNDPLTGLANRRRLVEFLSKLEIEPVSFVMMDIDLFKKFNDLYGHDVGDKVLTDLAEVFGECVRDEDMVARLGGEEFCVVFPGCGIDKATELSERLRMAVEVHDFKTSAGPLSVSISLGVAERRPEEEDTEWIKRADKALYTAKECSRNRVCRAD